MTFDHRFGRRCATFGLLAILILTLTPLPGGTAVASHRLLTCLLCGPHGGVDAVLNVILFIPFALGLRATGVPARRVVLLAAGLSLFVETMQLVLLPGREASLSDLLTNTTGGLAGALLGAHLRTFLMPRAAAARKLALAWGTAWLALWAVDAWLIEPWAPNSRLHSAWGVDIRGYGRFQGQVRAVTGDFPPTPDFFGPRGTMARYLAAGRLALTVDAVADTPRSVPAPIVGIVRGQNWRLLGGVFAFSNEVIFELPTRAHRFRLRAPALQLDGGMPPPGEPVHIAAALEGRTLRLASSYGSGANVHHQSTELTLSPSFGWSLVLPFNYAYGPEVRLLTGLWIAGLLLPLGYWTGLWWSARPRVAASVAAGAGLAALVAAGLAAIPRLTGYPPVHWTEWFAAAVGLTLGLALGWAVARTGLYLGGRCASPSTVESCSS